VFYLTDTGNGGSGNPREKSDLAIQQLEKAIALDSTFALAYARLARAYNIRQFGAIATDSQTEFRDRAYLAVQKALALDTTLAEAYSARGDVVWTRSFGFPHERAAADFKRAIALDPKLPWPHQSLGSLYLHIGLIERALAQYDTALALSHASPEARMRIARAHLYQGQYARALAEFEAVPEEDVTWQNAIALHYLGKSAEALAHVERLVRRFPRNADVASTYAILLAARGQRAAAETQIQHAVAVGSGSSHFHHAAYNIASAYAIMNDRARALEWLRRTAEEGMPCYPLFQSDPNLTNLRADERFQTFMNEMKLRYERYLATV
jgi:tetratricopeptide (TPR) repeat protein